MLVQIREQAVYWKKVIDNKLYLNPDAKIKFTVSTLTEAKKIYNKYFAIAEQFRIAADILKTTITTMR